MIGEPVCDVVMLWCCGAVACGGPAVRRSRNLGGQEGAFSESQSDDYLVSAVRETFNKHDLEVPDR